MGLVGGWLVWWNWVAFLSLKIPALLVLVVEKPDVMDFCFWVFHSWLYDLYNPNKWYRWTWNHCLYIYIYIADALCYVMLVSLLVLRIPYQPQPWRRWQFKESFDSYEIWGYIYLPRHHRIATKLAESLFWIYIYRYIFIFLFRALYRAMVQKRPMVECAQYEDKHFQIVGAFDQTQYATEGPKVPWQGWQ